MASSSSSPVPASSSSPFGSTSETIRAPTLKVQAIVEERDEPSMTASSSSFLAPFLSETEMSLASRDLEAIPEEVLTLGESIVTLDLSANRFRQLPGLTNFPSLERLVLDNNLLTEEAFAHFPKMQRLDTLWINNNLIKDITIFLDLVAKQAPRLTWLSLLKNPCCPNFFTGKDDDDYRRHRLYVLYRLNGLRFLDSHPVTPEELAEAKRVGHLMKTAQGKQSSAPAYSAEDDLEAQGLSALPASITRPGKGATTFGISRYVYYGKQSEGNRFIRDDAL